MSNNHYAVAEPADCVPAVPVLPPARRRTDTQIEREETSCGVFGWQPHWLQFFASAKFFVINFSILGIIQGALFTYMVGIMSTLEKRFAFETKVSGFILIADNLSQMVVSPIVGYLGSKYNRSVLIALGELVVALSCIMSAIPYYFYGPGIFLLQNSDPTESANKTDFHLCGFKDSGSECEEGGNHSTVLFAVVILWLSSFFNGLGYTAFYTIGLPYVDDNIKKKNSAMYLSYISTIRLLGPTLGFVLSAICLQFYEDPFMDPGITNSDPRWIGAWWLGFIILGVLIIIFTIPMFMFPKKFKEVKKPGGKPAEEDINTISDAIKAFKRLSKNYLLLCHMAGGVFRIIGYLGYYIIKPKYMELMYRQSASSASFFTGATSVATMAIGTMAGGFIIRYAKPSARKIAVFIMVVESISTLGIFSIMFLNCPTPEFKGLELINGHSIPPGLAPLDTCNKGCDCSTQSFQPVCSADRKFNYFSPCFAGCSTMNGTTFTECSCVEGPMDGGQWATSGLCENDCNKFPIFITIVAICNMIASTARTGDTLLTLRSVDPSDKSIAMGLMGSVFAVFAFIPYPLIFGAIIDSTCLIWEKSCGKSGNCWLYDLEKFRVYLHIGAVAFLVVGLMCEIGTIVFAGQARNIYEEDDEVEMKSIDNGNTEVKASDEEEVITSQPKTDQQ